jgi:hypothetical protein
MHPNKLLGLHMDIFETDQELVLELLNQGNDLLIVIRCHLLIESYIIKLIESVLPNPTALDIDKLNFSQKIGLALAVDAIHQDMKGLLLKLNSIRNKFAHNHLKKITDQDIAELESTLEKEIKNDLLSPGVYRCDCPTEKLAGIFLVAISYLQGQIGET